MLKKIACLIILALASSVAASPAQAFPMPATPYYNPYLAQISVCNTSWAYPISCVMQATGYTQVGIPISATGASVIYPGQCGYAYVYTYQPYYFISATGLADCQFY